ncbi:MAG: TetR family transcriptional regulator [Pseudomonadota bacterium]
MSVQTKRRTPGRPIANAPAVTREQIIEAALDMFAMDGFEAMSIRALARGLGVSHSLIHHYFESKQALWEAGVDLAFSTVTEIAYRLVDEIDERMKPAEAARAFVRETVIFAARHPASIKIALDEGARGGPRLDYIYSNYFGPANARWRETVAQLSEDNSGLNPVDARALFFLTAIGAATPFFARHLADYFEGGDLSDEKEIERHADVVASMIFDGLRVRPEDK